MQIRTSFNESFIELISLDKAKEIYEGVYLLVKTPRWLIYDSNTKRLSYFKTSIDIYLNDIRPESTGWIPKLAIATQLLPQFPEIKDVYLQCIKHKWLRSQQ